MVIEAHYNALIFRSSRIQIAYFTDKETEFQGREMS